MRGWVGKGMSPLLRPRASLLGLRGMPARTAGMLATAVVLPPSLQREQANC